MDLKSYMEERIPQVDARLEAILPLADRVPVRLHAAMRHAVFPGGKRFRPLLSMAAAEAVGGHARDAYSVGAAVELIHTYTLIHDDLPCMDDDALRRGRPTVHVAYGDALAVLAGDALQSLAFETLGDALGTHDGTSVALTMRDLAVAIGSRQLVGGQADDLEYAAEKSNADQIESVHARKTAALIALSVVGGARLAGAGERPLLAFRDFGLEVGIAFQIADDLLDEDEDDACSLVRAIGRDRAEARCSALLGSALGRIADWDERAEPLRELARYAAQRKV